MTNRFLRPLPSLLCKLIRTVSYHRLDLRAIWDVLLMVLVVVVVVGAGKEDVCLTLLVEMRMV